MSKATPERTAPPPSDDDSDLSLIRWLMSVTVSERLAILQAQANSLSKLRDACSESWHG